MTPTPLALARETGRTVAASVPEAGVIVAGRDLRVLHVQGSLLGRHGHRADLWIGRPLAETLPAAAWAELRPRYEAACSGLPQSFDYHSHDGRHAYWVQISPVPDAAGDVTSVVAVLLDVTARLELQDELAQSEARLREAERMVGVGSWELDLAGGGITCSDGFRRILGVPLDAAIDLDSFLGRVHPDDRDVVRAAIERGVREGSASVQYRIVRDDGSVRTLAVKGETIADSQGNTGHLRGAALDVTDQHEAEAERLRAVSLFRQAFDAAPIGMVLAAPDDLRLTRVNDAMCRILARGRDELLATTIAELTHPEDLPSVEAARRAMLDGVASHQQFEKRYVRPDGTVVWAALHVTPVLSPAGAIEAFCSQVIDVTERRERVAELDAARIESLTRLAIASEYRDDDTHEHTQRVARTAEQLGRALALGEADLALLHQAAPLHDVGKIGIPDAILLKPGKLTADERATVERHTLIGADILSESASPVLQLAERIALSHHERWDGSGYPFGLRGEDIPLAGRIVAIADVFDALTHDRPYKSAWPVQEAIDHIRSQRGSHFDPRVVDAFDTLDHASLLAPVGGAQAPRERCRSR